jgi:hypothetical protein
LAGRTNFHDLFAAIVADTSHRIRNLQALPGNKEEPIRMSSVASSILDETQRLHRSRETFVSFRDSEMLLVDWSSAQPPDVRESMARIRELLASRPGRKVLMLIDVHGTRWDAKLPFEVPAWSKEVAPKVGRLAITGIAGLQLAVLLGLRSLTGMPLLVFASVSEARAWLIRPQKK